MSAEREKPVDSALYSKDYFLGSCGGIEFFKRYGPSVLKPAGQNAFQAAGLSAGMKVLDIGCGRGELLYKAKEAGAWAVGTDYAEAALEVAEEVSACPVLRCDAKKLPFQAASFDRVFLIGVIDHLYDWEAALCFAEIARVLRPGGLVVVHTCVNRLYYKTLSYAVRRSAWLLACRLGLGLKEPSPPRSDEDEALHVNEHSYGHLRRFFHEIGWEAEIRCVPNHKLMLGELYGEKLPEGFPIRPSGSLKKSLYSWVLMKTPLARILAREFLILARPREKLY